MLKKVISGAQTGADVAGLEVAKKFGLETGGTMPFGFKSHAGPKPEFQEMYGICAHFSSSYVPRTRENVKNSDATIRLAFDFESSGEICTLKAINRFKKPYFDVDLNDPLPVSDVIEWLEKENVKTLNIAGNSERHVGTHEATTAYLTRLFEEMKNRA